MVASLIVIADFLARYLYQRRTGANLSSGVTRRVKLIAVGVASQVLYASVFSLNRESVGCH